MNKSYADVLESYLIEPAEEGIGGFLIGTAGFIAGVTLLGKITDARSRSKLKKEIRANAGKPAQYKNMYSILRKYSKDITGVLEPVNGKLYLKLWTELEVISRECDNLRDAFSSISEPTDPSSISKYKQINSKIKNMQSKVNVIIEKIKNIDLSEVSSNTVPLPSSNIEKIEDIVWDVFNDLWRGGHDGWSLIMTDDYYFSDAGGVIKSGAVPEADECVDNFDNLVRSIEDDDDPDSYIRKYISKCKFAINPNSNLK